MKTIPIIRQSQELPQAAEQWRKGINNLLKTPLAPKIPWNFTVTECRGGNQLTWAKVDGADGYEITRASSDDFTTTTTITIEGGDVTSYFDAITLSGSAMPKVGYKLRATAGNAQSKHSVKGKTTYPVFATPLDPSNTTSTGAVHHDLTTDKEQAVKKYRNRF